MALGRRGEIQEAMWIEASEIARGEGHVFYQALNELFRRHGFDRWVEELIERRKLFSDGVGRPSVAPGVYFRMSLVGYFEGLSSERGMAWRCADSLALREFLGYELTQATPDHSTLSRWRRKLPLSVHRDVFEWVVRMAREEGILKGRKVAIDSTTLEANAAMKSIVRKADGATYQQYLRNLAEAEGIEEPKPQDLSRMDRRRKGKKLSNRQWKSGTDRDARIARMKDGRTRMAYKVEAAVDVESRITLSAETHEADRGDAQTIASTLEAADETAMHAGVAGGIEDVIADRGYHADAVLVDLQDKGYRSYIAEPQVKGQRNWTRGQREGRYAAERRRRALYRNRRRGKSARGRTLQRKRAEYPERVFAHLKRSGGLSRVHVRGRKEVSKRVQLHAMAANLGVILRALSGAGTPRSLQGRLQEFLLAVVSALWTLVSMLQRTRTLLRKSTEQLTSEASMTTAPALVWAAAV